MGDIPRTRFYDCIQGLGSERGLPGFEYQEKSDSDQTHVISSLMSMVLPRTTDVNLPIYAPVTCK